MISAILLAAAVLVITALLVAFCCIRRRNRIRKVQEKVCREYLREQVILQQGYLDAYAALLRVAEKQERKAQNPAWSR